MVDLYLGNPARIFIQLSGSQFDQRADRMSRDGVFILSPYQIDNIKREIVADLSLR